MENRRDEKMNKQRMIRMLKNAKEAMVKAGVLNTKVADHERDELAVEWTPGSRELIGQLILASAIEESGSSISLSLDKLDKLALELGAVSAAIAISG